MYNKYRDDFPLLKEEGKNGLVYLDNGATTQKPQRVLDKVMEYYVKENANPHRGLYDLSVKATKSYEEAREEVSKFINSRSEKEIIFTRNTTESINMLAMTYGKQVIQEGDEIVVSILEHHSNLVPWQILAKEKNAVLKFLYLDKDYHIPKEEIENKITDKTKIVAITHVSNALGIKTPVSEIVEKAHKVGAIVVLDAAQSIPHMKIDVQAMDVDFLAFSGHKMLAPMGIGVLYGKEKLLERMPPFLTGGEMIEYVGEQDTTFAPLPLRFEAGTPNVGGAVGLMEAIRYINSIGYEEIERIDKELIEYAYEKMKENPHIVIYGNPLENQTGIISFNVMDVHPHDTASILDGDKVAVRAGHHCAQPLMKHLRVPATCRASFYIYNTKEDIDALVESLSKVRRVLGYVS